MKLENVKNLFISMFIQELFWNLKLRWQDVFHILVNDRYDFLPEQIEEKRFCNRRQISGECWRIGVCVNSEVIEA